MLEYTSIEDILIQAKFDSSIYINQYTFENGEERASKRKWNFLAFNKTLCQVTIHCDIGIIRTFNDEYLCVDVREIVSSHGGKIEPALSGISFFERSLSHWQTSERNDLSAVNSARCWIQFTVVGNSRQSDNSPLTITVNCFLFRRRNISVRNETLELFKLRIVIRHLESDIWNRDYA